MRLVAVIKLDGIPKPPFYKGFGFLVKTEEIRQNERNVEPQSPTTMPITPVTGKLSMPSQVLEALLGGLIPGEVLIPVHTSVPHPEVKGGELGSTKLCSFYRDPKRSTSTEVVGRVEVDPGEFQLLTIRPYPSGNPEDRYVWWYDYEVADIPEDDPSSDTNLGKHW
jgi:hypothetical protein